MKKVRVTQIKSTIGYKKEDKRTLEALGIKKINRSVIKTVNPCIDGMINAVSHLVKIEEVEE